MNPGEEQHMTRPRVALVTGSGKRRVGRSVADALADRGYHIIVHYHTSQLEAEEAVADLRLRGVNALAVQADLSDEAAALGLFQTALHHFGRLDVFVHCAGLWQRKKLEDVTAQDVRRHVEVNVLSTFLCAREAGLAMVQQPEGGCIITLGDWAVVRPYANYAAYFASKGAIPTLTRSLAVELATRNPRVRVCCVEPGPVLLPADLPEAERREAIDATLLQRAGTPENVASAVVALVENDFITGVCLPVDGGRTIFAPGK
jgi:pteridine reductase